MSKIKSAFRNGKAFIPFVTCGDPSLDVTEQIVYAMADAGATSSSWAFRSPTRPPRARSFRRRMCVRCPRARPRIRFSTWCAVSVKKTDIPMVFMTYANVVYSYGSERFIRTAAEIGMDGLILPDVPFEEKAEFDPLCRQYGIDLVSLIAPTSHDRIRMIAKEASGFVYCVSSLGVTGVRSNITTDIGAMVKLVKETQDIPCAVGFGISTPEQAAKMAAQSDGAIVGSAIVKICAKYGKDCVPHVKEYVKSMKDAVRNVN